MKLSFHNTQTGIMFFPRVFISPLLTWHFWYFPLQVSHTQYNIKLQASYTAKLQYNLYESDTSSRTEWYKLGQNLADVMFITSLDYFTFM